MQPEREPDAKLALYTGIRKTRWRRLIAEMVPQGRAHIAPMYNEHMCSFADRHWDIVRAAESAPSLARSVARIRQFTSSDNS